MAFWGMATCKWITQLRSQSAVRENHTFYPERSGDVISCDTCLQEKETGKD